MVPIKAIAEMSMHGQLEHFHSVVGDTFFPLSCESRSDNEGAFSGGVVSHQFGELGFAAVKTSPLDVYRRSSHIAKVSDAVYLVKVQVEGDGLVRQLGREAHLRPGDFALCLSCEPYELHFENNSTQVVLSVPQKILEECVKHPYQHLGVRMEYEDGANGLFSQFVTSIASRLDTLDGVLAQRLEANVIDLLSTTLGHTRETERRDLLSCGAKQEYLRRIRYFVRQNLHEEKLTPHSIAATHEISTRYLHMLFEEEGVSISRYIQRLRLEACQSALVDTSYFKYSVADIAYRFGFKNASHFSRAFKAEFGQAPARYRKQFQLS